MGLTRRWDTGFTPRISFAVDLAGKCSMARYGILKTLDVGSCWSFLPAAKILVYTSFPATKRLKNVKLQVLCTSRPTKSAPSPLPQKSYLWCSFDYWKVKFCKHYPALTSSNPNPTSQKSTRFQIATLETQPTGSSDHLPPFTSPARPAPKQSMPQISPQSSFTKNS